MFPNLIIQSSAARKDAQSTREEIRRRQQERFLRLANFISLHSPYYKGVIKQHRIDPRKCKPEDFPLLTKTQVIEHFDEIVTDPRVTKAKIADFLEGSTDPDELFLGKYYVTHTSGSSGTVGYFIYAQKELLKGLSNFLLVNRFKPFQRFAYIGLTRGHYAGLTMAGITKKMPGIYRDVRMFDINAPFNETIAGLNQMQPTNITGYAFALRKLAEAQRGGALHIRPRTIQSGAEPLLHDDKDFIQDTFDTPVTNAYSTTEHLLMGIGRDDFGGMYLMENNLIFEIEESETLVTNLYNYSLPLIRYQMSDRLRSIPDSTNRLPFTKVENVVGRSESVPVFRTRRGDEDFISPVVFVELFIKHVTRFQIQLIDKLSFAFKASLEPNLSDKEAERAIAAIRQKLQAILDEKMMTEVRFSIEVVDQLWADPKTGKFKLIVTPKESGIPDKTGLDCLV